MADRPHFPTIGGSGLDRRGTISGLIGAAITALAGALVAWSATAFGLVHLGVTTVQKRRSR